MKKHIISEKEYKEIREKIKQNQNKHIDKRLQVLKMRYEGKKDREIGEKLELHRKRVSQLCAEYKAVGLEEYSRRKYGGNNRNMSEEEEKAFLRQYEEAAKRGEIITIGEIAKAYDEAVGKDHESKSVVYSLLDRHKWREIVPRPKHPESASKEEIEESKKR